MEENISKTQNTVQVKTLEIEVKEFANSMPYWAKFLCSKILTNGNVSNSDIGIAYNYVAEELKLIEKTENPEIELNYNPNNSEDFKEKLVIDTLKNVQGVNALSENQTIEFSPNITIVYGVNGSGKSGYVRLLKNSFYSKHKENILQNIYKVGEQKPIGAEFNFISDSSNIPINYPEHATNGIFNQFAVFDSKIAIKHLEDRNDFKFRPAGLTIFSVFNSALEKIQQKINQEIGLKPTSNPYTNIFEGETEISTFINSLSSSSNLEDLKKHIPFTEQNKIDKQKADKDYDDLRIALNSKDKQIKALQDIKTQIDAVEKNLKAINLYFKQDYLNTISVSVTNCLTKADIAKKEGVENFKTDKIQNIGSIEWKEFIKSAGKFALKQNGTVYPEIGDNCILCQQPISQEQKELITNYWAFLRSVAEKEAKDTQTAIDNVKAGFQKISFLQFPNEHILTVWLKENFETELINFKQVLENQKLLSEKIIADIEVKAVGSYSEIQVDTTPITNIITAIETKIKQFNDDEQSKILTELLKKKTYLAHKEKLEQRFSDIEKLHQNMIWVNKANKFDKQYWKRNSTSTEKRLSQKYFNEQYIKTFNQECSYLNGNFGIDIDARSSDGQSNRQLFLKGKTPSAVLSEGEQKVIAIADFMTETKLSTINKGIFLDDPVNSLDEERKSIIAERLVSETQNRQVVIFTHDLVFLSNIINYCGDNSLNYKCHWIENFDGEAGKIWLDNTPSYEKKYKKSGIAQKHYKKAKNAAPEERESSVKSGFAALRSSYEAFVIFDLFAGVVQRFNDRVSIDSLNSVYIDNEIVKEIMDSFGLACRYMEGHNHSDKFLSKKPTPEQLNEEIQRFDSLKKKLKELKKQSTKA